MPIDCDEERRHFSITFVEQLDVVRPNGVKKDGDKMTVGNEEHPQGSRLPQVAFAHLLLVGVILDEC